jgi:hypothetical protein
MKNCIKVWKPSAFLAFFFWRLNFCLLNPCEILHSLQNCVFIFEAKNICFWKLVILFKNLYFFQLKYNPYIQHFGKPEGNCWNNEWCAVGYVSNYEGRWNFVLLNRIKPLGKNVGKRYRKTELLEKRRRIQYDIGSVLQLFYFQSERTPYASIYTSSPVRAMQACWSKLVGKVWRHWM